MPVQGRKPKPDGQQRQPGRQRHDWTEIANVPYEGPVPKLPAERANGKKWPARTKRKWKIWSAMPHCVLWTDSDWEFALESLEVAAIFHETGAANMATELRNREKLLGTTLDYRRDLRIRYVEPNQQTEEVADVPSLDEYRDRFGA